MPVKDSPPMTESTVRDEPLDGVSENSGSNDDEAVPFHQNSSSNEGEYFEGDEADYQETEESEEDEDRVALVYQHHGTIRREDEEEEPDFGDEDDSFDEQEFLEEDCDGHITIKEDFEDENNGKIAAALVEAIIEQESNEAGAVQQQRILTSNIALGSLLKYDTPLALKKDTSTEEQRYGTPIPVAPGLTDQESGKVSAPPEEAAEEDQPHLGSTSASGPNGSLLSTASKKSMQQVIDMILPPLLWEQDGELWMQQVSSKPATRLDVLNLQRLLDIRLEHRQAKETGICPIRRELYTQAFDELIRQVTVNCAERGLLLLRVRDELKMTLAAYQTLFESSCAFGIRKSLQAKEGREDLEKKVDQLEKEKAALLEECDRLRGQLEDANRLHEEQRAVEADTHKEKIEFYQHKVQQIKNQLEAILAAKK